MMQKAVLQKLTCLRGKLAFRSAFGALALYGVSLLASTGCSVGFHSLPNSNSSSSSSAEGSNGDSSGMGAGMSPSSGPSSIGGSTDGSSSNGGAGGLPPTPTPSQTPPASTPTPTPVPTPPPVSTPGASLPNGNGPTMRTGDLIANLGLNTHISFGLMTGTQVANDMKFLGLSLIRDNWPNGDAASIAGYETVMASGVKIEIAMPCCTVNQSQALTDVMTLTVARPGMVVMIEGGPNEDNADPTGANKIQQQMYSAFKSAFPMIPISLWPVGDLMNNLSIEQMISQVAAYGDVNNLHDYYFTEMVHGGGQDMYTSLKLNYLPAAQSAIGPGHPVFTSETGFDLIPGDYGQVNEDVQAKLDMDEIFDHAALGVLPMYFYELIDDAPGGGYGVYDNSNTIRAAGTDLHNLIAILQDAGASARSFASQSLAYTTSGLPAHGYTYLMQKSNGAFMLALWNEAQIWNNGNQVSVPAASVTVNLPSSVSVVNLFDPTLGTTTTQTWSQVSTVNVSLSDHPLILEINP